MKPPQRIQIKLHKPGAAVRLFDLCQILFLWHYLGLIHWSLQALFVIAYVAGAHFRFNLIAANSAGTNQAQQKKATAAEILEEAAQAPGWKNATGLSGPPPSDMEIHFLANPNVPESWKLSYCVDTPEGKAKFLKSYYSMVQTGKLGGYKK